MTAPILLRVNIVGFHGEAASVYGAFDPATEVLLIQKLGKKYEGKARAGFVHVTNESRDDGQDSLFTEENLSAAIGAFYELQAMRLITYGGEQGRLDPASKLQRKGLKETGIEYELHPETTCAQVAVLAACLWASQQRGVAGALDMLDDFAAITI